MVHQAGHDPFGPGKDLSDPATFSSLGDGPQVPKAPKTLDELIAEWEDSPQQWGNTEAWEARDPRMQDSAVLGLADIAASAGDYEPNRLGRFRLPNLEAEQMQRFRGKTGSSDPYGPETVGTATDAPEPYDPWADLLGLYSELHKGDTDAANSYFNTIKEYLGEQEGTRANQIFQDTATINTQMDDIFAETERRDKTNDLNFELEFQDAIDGMADTQEAADARLGQWGINPQRWTAGAGAETAALLVSQAQSGARFANEMGSIMKMAHGMADARVNQGMQAESRNLANTVSQLGLQANLQLKSNLQAIDRELVMNKIGAEQASMAMDAANQQAEAASAAAFNAYAVLAKATRTSSQLWQAADTVGITDDLFARTPMIPEIPDNTRPWGGMQIQPEGLQPMDAFYSSPAELQQVLETYLKMHSGDA